MFLLKGDFVQCTGSILSGESSAATLLKIPGGNPEIPPPCILVVQSELELHTDAHVRCCDADSNGLANVSPSRKMCTICASLQAIRNLISTSARQMQGTCTRLKFGVLCPEEFRDPTQVSRL